MAIQILPEKFEDDITSLVEEKILNHNLSFFSLQPCVHSTVKFLWTKNLLGKLENMDLKNSFDDGMKRSYEDTEFNHFVGVYEHQNPGIMSFELIQNKDAKFKFYRKRNAKLISNDILHAFVDCPMHCFTYNDEPCVALKFTQPLAKDGKLTSKLQDNSTISDKSIKNKETMPASYPVFQHKRKEIAQHVSFVVVMSIIFGGLFFDMWIQPSHMKIQSVSIWTSLLGLFGFMVFVWAVAIMILVGVPFVSMQSFVVIFWAIWMHLKSHNNSITAMFVPMLGIVFFGVFARGKV